MQQPSRNRETGQRLTREELSPGSGFGRMADIGALATAASAMAIGTLAAKERPAGDGDDVLKASSTHVDTTDDDRAGAGQAETVGRSAAPASIGEPARSTEDHQPASHAQPSGDIWDPSALTARIAEQIASSVSRVLDIAAGEDGTPQSLSRDIVEQAQHIAHEVHEQFVAQEPLAVLADLVPHDMRLDTLGQDIIQSVDASLAESGVMDLLNGVAAVADPDRIIGDIVADLHGLKLPVDVAGLVADPLETVADISGSLLGGADHGKNPLADLFYDDGGADSASGALGDVVGGVTDLVAEIPKIGFLGQPLEPAEELGGLTHGHNALQVL